MRSSVAASIFASIVGLCGAASAAVLAKGELEVVVAADAPPVVKFAAQEATNFLSQVLGAEVPVASEPGSGKSHLFLGTNRWSVAAGVSVAGIATDGFVVMADERDVFIASADDPSVDPVARIRKPWWGSHMYDHGTLNGVYAFLERFADVRFYFPGELGTCVARKERLSVPAGRIVEEPALTIRRWSYYSDGEWPEGEDARRTIHPKKALNILRNKASTSNYGCCHGLRGFCYVERFGKTHPEYFALDAKGNRMIEGKGWERGHLCFSSGIREEIFRDCLSFVKGEDASVRGIPSMNRKGTFGWNYNTTSRYIDIMPQDGHAACYCEKCKALLRKDGRDCPATELVWGLLAEVAERLRKEGFEPTLTMMSYADYADLPDCQLPTNIKVMVAKTGPWKNTVPGNVDSDAAFFDAWARRLGEKTWIWTYPLRGETVNFNVPGWAPRTWGRYYKGVAPHVFGIFAQSETDRCIDNLLGYYVLSKICWNPDVDVDALIDEFFRRMFAAAADDMKKALDDAEDKFVNKVVGRLRMTDKGPVADRPGDYILWMDVYSEAETARLKMYYDAAARKVPKDSVEARRVALFRRWMLDPVVNRGREYRSGIDTKAGIAYYKAHEKDNLLGDVWWVAPDHGASRDRETTIVGVESKKLTVARPRTSAWALSNKMKKGLSVEPGGKYSLSWFTKVDLEPTQCGGGAAVSVTLAAPGEEWVKEWKVPERFTYHSGKVDWIWQTFEFTVPDDAPAGTRCSVMPYVRSGVGEAWFDGLLLLRQQPLEKGENE